VTNKRLSDFRIIKGQETHYTFQHSPTGCLAGVGGMRSNLSFWLLGLNIPSAGPCFVTGSFSFLFRRDDSLQGCDHGREICRDHIPDDIVVNLQVVVDDFVAHANDVGPRNLWVAPSHICGDTPDCFPDDLDKVILRHMAHRRQPTRDPGFCGSEIWASRDPPCSRREAEKAPLLSE